MKIDVTCWLFRQFLLARAWIKRLIWLNSRTHIISISISFIFILGEKRKNQRKFIWFCLNLDSLLCRLRFSLFPVILKKHSENESNHLHELEKTWWKIFCQKWIFSINVIKSNECNRVHIPLSRPHHRNGEKTKLLDLFSTSFFSIFCNSFVLFLRRVVFLEKLLIPLSSTVPMATSFLWKSCLVLFSFFVEFQRWLHMYVCSVEQFFTSDFFRSKMKLIGSTWNA